MYIHICIHVHVYLPSTLPTRLYQNEPLENGWIRGKVCVQLGSAARNPQDKVPPEPARAGGGEDAY